MQNKTAGFTLLEMMLVVVIIGILASMVLPNLAGRGEQARRSACRADIETSLSIALDLFEMDQGRYPTTQEGLQALIDKPAGIMDQGHWHGPYLKKKMIPLDPWGHPYIYVCPGINNRDSYDLSSNGPDGFSGNDDIANWLQGK